MPKNIAKIIALQHQHVYSLLKKIEELEQTMSTELLSKKNWYKFVEKHTDPITIAYISRDLPAKWYDTSVFHYDISYNFYRGPAAYDGRDKDNINYFDMTIGINMQSKGFSKSSIPMTMNIVTESIEIKELNDFLNEEDTVEE